MSVNLLRNGPGYWANETGGQLAPVVKKYLESHRSARLSPQEIRLLRAYFVQWAASPVWDANAYQDGFGRAALQSLRADARSIRTMKQVDQWLRDALELGMDPL